MAARRRFSRKGERGMTVVVVVLVTTLITAIGIFAVRNVSQIDQAAGYSRQSGQSTALAELGTTVGLAEVSSQGTKRMTGGSWCRANGPYAKELVSSCFKMDRAAFEAQMATYSGHTLLEPTVAGTETGSFGPLANTTGIIEVEVTDKHQTNRPMAGVSASTTSGTTGPFDVTVTTLATVSPITSSSDQCDDGVATMAVTKVVRAHLISPN